MRRIATTSRTTLNRASRANLARSTSRVSSSGVPTSTATPRIAVGYRSLATIANPHMPASSPPSSSSLPRKPLFSKILIANRGEIAVRIIRTCKKLGIKTVAVFSEADRNAMHVKMADEAYLLGPAPSHLSYLNIPRLLEVCHQSGAQAVHPGYGFMSENADFARQLEKEGIVFIGPGVEAIVSMGSKAESKDIMKAADVPCIPGWHPSTTGNNPIDPSVDTQSPSFLILEADKIGYPVLIKAVSGGGGKGMKIVENREEFESQLESAKREGRKSFGDDTVLLEKYVTKPRHVEVQIFSDSHGNHLSLFERDCSVQRRHQKVIEEAPAPNLSSEVREKLYETARKAARAVGYRGAGTVEFVLNADRPEEFFFLEVNTRLQVEHPVTEAITGVDLVEWQLEVAAGNPIPLKQEEITCTGHAFEVRVYAENPRNNFLPDTGTLLHVKTPKESDYVRLETGFEAGDEISVFYDPLIAKLIVHGPNRREALKRLTKALGEYQIVGPSTNLEFLSRLAANEAFADEDLDTGFIPRHYDSLFPPLPAPSPSTLASTALFLANREISHFTSLNPTSPWTSPRLAGFRLGEGEGNRYRRSYETGQGKLSVSPAKEGGSQAGFDVTFEPSASSSSASTEAVTLFGAQPRFSSSTGTSATVSTLLSNQLSRVDLVSSTPSTAQILESGVAENIHAFNEAESFAGTIEVKQPSWMKNVGSKKGGLAGGKAGGARAPMPSKIVEVKVKVGDRVEAGQQLVIVEAMKMEHVLKAPKAGIVEKVTAKEGDLVKEGQLLVVFEAEEGEESLASPSPFISSSLLRLILSTPTAQFRPYSTNNKKYFLDQDEPEDCYYPWTGLTAFRAAHKTERSKHSYSLNNLILARLHSLPIRNQDGSLSVYYPSESDRGVRGSFLLSHSQVVNIQNSMVNQGKIPRAEIEQAWEAAQRPVVRKKNMRSGLQELRLKDRVDIQGFARREVEKKDVKGEPGNEEGVWKPTPFEGSLPDALMSWSSIQTVSRKRKLDYPRDFLRRLLLQAGIINGLVIIKAAPTQGAKKQGNGEVAIFFPWTLVKKVFQQFGLTPEILLKEDGATQTPTTTRRGVEKFIAHGLVEAERTLSFFGQPLRKMSPSLRSRLRHAAFGEVVQKEVIGEQRLTAWSSIRTAHDRYLRFTILPSDDPTLPRRTSLAALDHLFDTSPGNTLLMVEATDARNNSKAAPVVKDLYHPYEEAIRTLRDQGVLADETSPKKLKAKLGTELRTWSIEELQNPQPVKISCITQFENRMKACQKPEEWKAAMPWLEDPVQPPAVESKEPSKGTKRAVTAVERTMGQLLTPAPSLESTPEPIPPPLKRVKSSGIVQTVSKLSITSTPSTPLPSPTVASPAPSALIPSSHDPNVDISDAKVAASKSFELETLRHVYETAEREGGASFLALDVEFWERDHEVLTEFGWSLVEFVKHQNGKVSAKREDQHAVIKENQRFRNGRFSPDARDHFDFGRTLTLPSGALFYLLHALFSTLSTTHPLFLIFHDPRGDIKALTKLGFDPQKEFERDLKHFGKKREGGGIWVVDTQRVFGGWLGRKGQIGLEKACVEVNVPTRRLHNAGNDAHYTLALLEKLMDRSLRPADDSALIRLLDDRAAAAKRAKLLSAEKREKEKETAEQAALKR